MTESQYQQIIEFLSREPNEHVVDDFGDVNVFKGILELLKMQYEVWNENHSNHTPPKLIRVKHSAIRPDIIGAIHVSELWTYEKGQSTDIPCVSVELMGDKSQTINFPCDSEEEAISLAESLISEVNAALDNPNTHLP